MCYFFVVASTNYFDGTFLLSYATISLKDTLKNLQNSVISGFSMEHAL